jgi:hypothetical protein
MTAVFMLLVTALSVLLAHANPAAKAQTRQAGPPLPYVVDDACPFEGCAFRPWVVGRRVAVRTRRSKTAPIAFTVNRWDWVRAVTGVFVTYEPVLVRFTRDTQVPVPRRKGETLQVLEYVGEGFGTIWFDGQVIEDADLSSIYNGVCEFSPNSCDGHIERRGRQEWWVQIENAEGVLGWTDQTDAFGNKDVYGGPWQEQMPRPDASQHRPRVRP